MTASTETKSSTMSIDELASVLEVSRANLYRLARQGRLPVQPIRVGQMYRFSRKAVNELLAGHHEENSREASAA